MKIIIVLMAVCGFACLLNLGCAAIRSGYESAPYRVAQAKGKFELRDYSKLLIVETPMRDGDSSFLRLFHYIGGQNAASKKIPMTTPVFICGGQTNATMSFVLPKNINIDLAPKPAGSDLRLRELPAGRFAVLRFRGGRNAGNETHALAKLEAWLTQQSLKPEGGPIYGYFDPPWTPPFLRRNEVMLRLATAP